MSHERLETGKRCRAILWWHNSSAKAAWERGIFLGKRANNPDE